MSKDRVYHVPALDRGLAILEFLADRPEGALVPEMNGLGLPPASLYRMLSTLEARGYITRSDAGRWRLTRKLFLLAGKSVDESGLIAKCSETMHRLRDLTDETVTVSVLSGDSGIIVDQAVSNRPVKVSLKLGHHFPLHTAAPAKAMLAFLPEAELKERIRSIRFTKFTEMTIDNAEDFRRELVCVRRDGIAFDRGEELPDFQCIAAPVFDYHNRPAASICLNIPAARLTAPVRKKMIGLLLSAVEDLNTK